MKNILSRNKSHTIAETLTSKRQRDEPTANRMGNLSGGEPVEVSAERLIVSEMPHRK